ncbi:MAG: hypothetical protein EB127_28480 [Alphaproteobacteria bacterium]|nr:hypothetical protein [Alphaproteobacteria bacterium]
MHHYSGYTIPLSNDQLFTLLEFGEIKWIDPVRSVSKCEFILHSYSTGEIQYEALINNTVFLYTEAQLKGTKACLPGSFKEQDGLTLYHLSDYEVYTLQVSGECKLFDLEDDSDLVRIGQFLKINLGGNYKNIIWVGDILCYFYESDKSDIDCPY